MSALAIVLGILCVAGLAVLVVVILRRQAITQIRFAVAPAPIPVVDDAETAPMWRAHEADLDKTVLEPVPPDLLALTDRVLETESVRNPAFERPAHGDFDDPTCPERVPHWSNAGHQSSTRVGGWSAP